ncbi:hypothetical protein ABIA16_003559 [Sinorhizobium fredii]
MPKKKMTAFEMQMSMMLSQLSVKIDAEQKKAAKKSKAKKAA